MPDLVSISKIKKANQNMVALLNKPRQQIITIIRSNDNKIVVNKIVRTVKLAQSTVSSHLKVLLQAKMVTTQVKGRNIYYSVNFKAVNKLTEACKKLVGEF
jgi:DNA-binding transcriptional ArsR family regulator